ncbi:hypothetical protein ACFQGT_04560 [Natrialbaceae archaeon GCM10025810]|uniref:hypothetical protein n=1 Tax=Halovalidus salilacus TaxID=3075124 RepID=UPI00361D9EB5
MNPFWNRASADGDATASGDGTAASGTGFDDWETFDPDHVPEPGPFLEGHDVLEGEDHVAFHRVTRDLFEERGVYDATFGYNLAKLNLDRRHPDAGFRYAVDADDPSVLRAEFTPTTEFCPQADALVRGSFRAWNGLSEEHDYDEVRVRVHPSHYQADPLNDSLDRLEAEFHETGRVPGEPGSTSRNCGDEPTGESPF